MLSEASLFFNENSGSDQMEKGTNMVTFSWDILGFDP